MATGSINQPYSKYNEIGNTEFYESYVANVPKSDSINVNIPNSYRGFLLFFGSSTTLLGFYMVNCSSGGTVTVAPILTASDITITRTTNTLNLANANTGLTALTHAISLSHGKPTVIT